MAVKVCAITTIHNTMDWFVTEAMRHLQANGFEVSLMCDMPDDFIRRNSDYARCLPLKMERGIDPIGAIKSIYTMYRIFRREKFDIIQYSTPNAALYASVAGTLAGVKVRIYDQCGIRYVSFSGWRRRLFRFLERFTCSMSTLVRGQSPKNRQFAIDEKLCPEEKIIVLGIGGTIGVDLNEFDLSKKAQWRAEIRSKWNIPVESFVFGYVGRLNVDKGINELVDAFRMLSGGDQQVRLLLVGMDDDGLTPELKEWAEKSPQVIMTGNVPSSEVCSYMSALDMLVHPTYREGFGKVLQEAMALGIPIITTDVPGPSEVIQAGISGVLVSLRDPERLTLAMTELMRSPEKRKAFGEAGLERARRYFARPVMLKNILNNYLEITEANGMKRP